ncbi:hypothetical protein [Desulfovibrio ferrophilus]|uniref:Uncharacterized protein n=1 Tax=Desulfovibrio ferrophilus TaxID=241368 RepID=A0A2Z6B2M6_9BACT|nr:hypothetical protein [Desulfovibrio ferrophilus]BBD09767.1 uncharacterized protein DFE_3041 [Desulfovibrio ferrophilus]
MGVVLELATNAWHSTSQGMLGVSLIFIYMAVIVGVALMRIKQHGHH